MPDALLLEMENFVERNALITVASHLEDKKPIKQCCRKCLKAHLFKKFGRDFEKLLNWVFDCETGHGGYYLDGQNLIKI